MIKNTVAAVPLRSQIGALLTALFTPINAGGLTEPCFFLRINNATNRDVFLSFDGVTEHEFLAQGQFIEIPNQAGNRPSNHVALWAANTTVYVKAALGAGTGAIYVSGYYQPQNK